MVRPQADIAFTAVVLLLAVLALIFGGWLIAQPPIPLGSDILAMSPSVFPTLIVAGTAIVSLLFLVGQARVGMLWRTPGTSAPATQAAAIYRQILFVAITVACALALPLLGFLTTMFLLMASTSILVGNRSPIQILSLSIVLPLSFYVAVTHVLRTELPEADVIERALAPFIQLLPSV
ncbi:MAG: tripartite tricarboxylate transporter TctB family protein [Candidatus Rariloculaceae bacterium]